MDSKRADKQWRRDYLHSLLQALCVDIGARPSGSSQFDESISLIANEMRAVLPLVGLDRFEFVAWEVNGEPQFSCGSRQMETYLDYGSKGTPDGGIRGGIRKVDWSSRIYEIIDESGSPQAYAILNQFGEAAPFSVFFRENIDTSLPIFNLGKNQEPILGEAENRRTGVFACAKTNFHPATKSCSVIGTLPGSCDQEILILAHADTQYNTPGANDNSASLIVMLMLARALSEVRLKYTVVFAATGGEEIGLLGSRHYAETRRMRKDIGRIKFCINFDSLTYGPDFLITSRDGELDSLMAAVFSDLNLEGKPRFARQGSFLDAEPFVQAGARTLYINSRGYDEEVLPLWHRPEDLPHTVHPGLVENAYRAVKEFVLRLQDLP